jgi:hypothetical protein
VPVLEFDKPIKFSYEFKNVGTEPWRGYLLVKVTDEYKKWVYDQSVPPLVPTVSPGDTIVLDRYVTVPRTIIIKGNKRTWGKKSSYSISVYTV